MNINYITLVLPVVLTLTVICRPTRGTANWHSVCAATLGIIAQEILKEILFQVITIFLISIFINPDIQVGLSENIKLFYIGSTNVLFNN